MPDTIAAEALKARLYEGEEIALIDVREAGQYGEGHILFAAPAPYSRFESILPRIVPRQSAPLVLYDDGDGVAARAAMRATAMGYIRVSILEGGAAAWAEAGHTLFKGVNVPSKVFGELVEHAWDTPRIAAADVSAMASAGENMVIVDGRPFSEYEKMSIPGGICCPNGELALRIRAIAPDPATKVVVNCAGRTRSIIGAQTLLDLGVENPVMALENGTQGWFLAGLELEHGAARPIPEPPADLAAERQKAATLAGNAETVSLDDLTGWLAEEERTTFVFDVRTATEHERDFSAADGGRTVIHAPGGQLVQATDQWIGVRRARIVLADLDGVRAPVIANWLRRLGAEAYLCPLDAAGADRLSRTMAAMPSPSMAGDPPETIDASALASLTGSPDLRIIDLRSSTDHRAAHIEGAVWATRPRIEAAVRSLEDRHVLVADDPAVARAAAMDLAEIGCRDVVLLAGDPVAAGLPMASDPGAPSDADSIDYLFFVHDRHQGNAEAARGYIAWETGLVDQLDAAERGVFRI